MSLAPIPWDRRGQGLVWPNPAVGCFIVATGNRDRRNGVGGTQAGRQTPRRTEKALRQSRASAGQGAANGPNVHALNPFGPIYRQGPRPCADWPLWLAKVAARC